MGRVVLEASVVRRIVRGSDHDAVGETLLAISIVGQDCVRDDRSRRVALIACHTNLHIVGGQDFQGSHVRWGGECVGVTAQEQRSFYTALPAIVGDRLADGQNVGLVEAVPQRGSSMS